MSVGRMQSQAIPKAPLSRLGEFMRDHRIPTGLLAARSAVSRRYLVDLRYDRCDPTRGVMVRIAVAAGHILGTRVQVEQLFDFSTGFDRPE